MNAEPETLNATPHLNAPLGITKRLPPQKQAGMGFALLYSPSRAHQKMCILLSIKILHPTPAQGGLGFESLVFGGLRLEGLRGLGFSLGSRV